MSCTPRRLLIGCGLLAFASPAFAQTASDIGTLAEIVVTAQRRSEAVDKVPLAISVLPGSELATRGVTNVNQLQYQVPGLEAVPAFGGGQPNFRLRGVGFDDYASNNASPVGVYVDQVAKSFPIETQGLLFDLERVEVLRGPQGTLYGRNTTAGAINFVTAKPTDTLSAGVDADYGRFGLFRDEAHLSGPLGGGFSARVAAATEQGGGFQHDRDDGRSLGDADRIGVRGELAYQGGAVDALLEGHYGRDTSDATGLYLFDPLSAPFGGATIGIPADTSHRATGWGASAMFANLLGIQRDTRPFRDNDTEGGGATVTLDLGGPKLTSVTGYDRFHRREYNDWDASALAYAGTFFGSRARGFSQEVRLASGDSTGTRWIVGGYYADEHLAERFDSDFVDSLGFVAITAYRQRARTIAGFGQVDYPVTSRLTLTGGARVEHERRTLYDFTTAIEGGPALVADATDTLGYTRVSGKAALDFQLSDRALLYVSASKGIKSGGFTAYNTQDPSQLAPFRPETLYAYEIGGKNRIVGNRLRLNTAAFYYDYRDQQVQSAIYTTAYGAIGKIVNAPKSHIYGIEAELTWAPARGLEIVQGLSWRKGKFDRFDDLDVAASQAAHATRTVSRAGQDEGFPHWSYTGSVTYRVPVGRFDVTAATNYAYHGPMQPVLLGPNFRVHDYFLLDGTLSLGPRGGRWSVGIYGRNILDRRYDLTRNFFLGGIDIASPGRPASYGARGRYSF